MRYEKEREAYERMLDEEEEREKVRPAYYGTRGEPILTKLNLSLLPKVVKAKEEKVLQRANSYAVIHCAMKLQRWYRERRAIRGVGKVGSTGLVEKDLAPRRNNEERRNLF